MCFDVKPMLFNKTVKLRTTEKDRKSIHSLLADGKHEEAITWAKQYFDNHPCKLTLETIITCLNTLLESCKRNDVGSLGIKDCIN